MLDKLEIIMSDDPWHYPRTVLAKHLINGMRNNLLDRVSIFAYRKRGKTQFIKRDIIPMCREIGIVPIYVDFWADKSNPHACFMQSVLQAIEDNESFFDKLKGFFNISKVGTEIGSAKVELDVNTAEKSVHSELINVFNRLNRLDMPILLLLDEVQHLATRPEFDNFTSALRSFVVNRGDSNVKCIFTGSSQEGLSQLFKDSKAPFFNSAQTQKFDELGEDFVRFELNTFKTVTRGVELNFDDAMLILLKQNRAPARFVEMLKLMALNCEYDINVGFSRFDKDFLESKQIYEDLHEQMSEIDIAILKLVLAAETRGLYSEVGLRKVSAMCPNTELSGNVVTKNKVQKSVQKLKKLGVLYSSGFGKLEFENLDFKDYLLSR